MTKVVYCHGARYYNRLTGAGSTSYSYDANGNTITKTGGWTYSYDYENRLTKATQSGTTLQTNSYDGDGNRVKQVAGSSTFTYSYHGLNVLYEKNVTSGTTTITKHFYAGGLQVAKTVGTSVYYLHQDALGSTRLVATNTVTIKFSSNYVPYGSNWAVSGKEVFMYTGKPYDSATGLYYEGARYYDPTTGRFVTQDSYAGDRNDPMTMNRYIYARDNPEKMVDPNGHMALLAIEVDGTSTVVAKGLYGTFNLQQSVQASAPRTTVDYNDVNRISYTSSPTTVTVGTSAKSVDVTLTQQGVDQYVNTPTIGAPDMGPFSTCKGATAAGIFTVFTSGMGLYVAGELAGSEVLTGTALTIATGGLAALPFIAIVITYYLWQNDPTCHG